jgi:hydroxymethylpyrimidine kinase/phosphomethylpyrimidine kinase
MVLMLRLKGMLASATTVSLVAKSLREHNITKSVIDPVCHHDQRIDSDGLLTRIKQVMVSTSGSQLLPEAATKTLIHELLPVAYLVTPNIPEANLIMREAGKTAHEVHDLDGLKQLATAILDLGPEYVLLKGGHLPLTKEGKVAVNDSDKEVVTNVLVGRNGDVEVVEVPFQTSKNTHGTGCSLASAIACNLAKDDDVKKAVRSACHYVEAAIKTSPNLGKGSGPLNHFHSLQVLPFSS